MQYNSWRVLAHCAISSEDGLNCGGINWGWSGIIRLFLLSELQQPNNIHFGIGIKSYQKVLKCTSKIQLSSHSFWKGNSWLLLTKSPQSGSLWSMVYMETRAVISLSINILFLKSTKLYHHQHHPQPKRALNSIYLRFYHA